MPKLKSEVWCNGKRYKAGEEVPPGVDLKKQPWLADPDPEPVTKPAPSAPKTAKSRKDSSDA